MGNISLNLHMIKEGKKCISSQGNMVKQKEGSIVKQYEKNPYIIVCNVALIIFSIPVANDSVAYINNLIIITDGMVTWIACTMKKKTQISEIRYTLYIFHFFISFSTHNWVAISRNGLHEYEEHERYTKVVWIRKELELK